MAGAFVALMDKLSGKDDKRDEKKPVLKPSCQMKSEHP